jgi:hypothetical protein
MVPLFCRKKTKTVTKLLAVLLITKGLKIIFCLFVGYEENQGTELAVDAARGRHARRQKSHMLVAAICVVIIADLVGILSAAALSRMWSGLSGLR